MEVLKLVVRQDAAAQFEEILALNPQLHKLQVDGYPLPLFAAAQNSPNVLKRLLQIPGVAQAHSKFLETILHVAAEQQAFHCIKEIITDQNGQELVGQQDKDGATALMKLIDTMDMPADLDDLVLSKMSILQEEIGIESDGETAFTHFIDRLIECKTRVSRDVFTQFVNFFLPELEKAPVMSRIFDAGRGDLFELLAEKIKFRPQDFK